MGVEPTRTGFANRCLSRSTITPLLCSIITIPPSRRKIKCGTVFFAKKPRRRGSIVPAMIGREQRDPSPPIRGRFKKNGKKTLKEFEKLRQLCYI